MITTIIAIASMSMSFAGSDVQCAVQPDPINVKLGLYDYAGVRYGTCCAGCVGPFTKEPAKFIKAAADKNRTIGVALFDPMTGVRIDEKKAKGGYSDFKGTRFFFGTAESKTAFDAAPAKFAISPPKEALFCPVMGHAVKDYSSAGAIADAEGIRFYLCCTDCLAAFKANPGQFASKAAANVAPAKLINAPKEKAG